MHIKKQFYLSRISCMTKAKIVATIVHNYGKLYRDLTQKRLL